MTPFNKKLITFFWITAVLATYFYHFWLALGFAVTGTALLWFTDPENQ